MSMSRPKLLNSLRQLQKERKKLLKRLINDKEVAIGSVAVVRRKCGKPNCHCVEGFGHPQTLFLFRDEGRRRCKLIRQSDSKRLLIAGERYRNFRNGLRELRAINKRENKILMAITALKSIIYE